MYGSIFYSDVPAKAKTVKGIDGAAIPYDVEDSPSSKRNERFGL